jgi:K+/H+ antiporter YhaU regulatory subunit KhtT
VLPGDIHREHSIREEIEKKLNSTFPDLLRNVRERFGVTIIAVNSPDGGILVNPPPATTNQSGDRLRVFGLPKQIAEFEIYVGAKAKA